MNSLRLGVEVVSARNLMPEDGKGKSNYSVELHFGGQRLHTALATVREKDLDPVWKESLYFNISDPSSLSKLCLDAYVYRNIKFKGNSSRSILGKVHLTDRSIFVPVADAVISHYPLEKHGMFSRVKGELALIVYLTGDPTLKPSSNLLPAIDPSARPKVYFSPSLWYVRVNIISADDLVVAEKSRIPKVSVEAQIGHQRLKTRLVHAPEFNPLWNEDLLFVAAEPFEDHLILSVEDFEGSNRVEVIGRVVIPLSSIKKRVDNGVIAVGRYQLEKPVVAVDVDQLKEEEELPGSLLLRLCLEGGYHVLDESPHYCSDLRPAAKELWNPPIGVLELGILRAEGLHPTKTRDERGTSDTFCVARYGHEWVRTRTIVNSLTPKFDEHHTWDVYDPATVLTVGLFGSSQPGSSSTTSNNNDRKIGKVRIRLSTLEPGRLYTHSYPLLVLHPSGVKKMGELLLAIKFSCTSLVNMMYVYSRPLLPKMHYIRPLTVIQLDALRFQAVNIVAARLSRAEPPLQKEVVKYMSDVDPLMWSIRRSKANFFRLVAVFSGLIAVGKWFGDVCMWKNPAKTMLIHVLFIMLVYFHQFILPMLLLYMFFMGLWNCRYRPCSPPHTETKISCAETVHPDELDEEFDTFPTCRSQGIVRMRYDRMRSVAGRIQTVVGDVATYGERVLSLLSWRDPVATAIFLIFCFVSALVLFVTPYEVIIVVVGFYKMRHPWLQQRLPSVPVSFFQRLPSKIDNML